MLKKLLLTLLIAIQLIACTPTDKAALNQFNNDAPTFVTLQTQDDATHTKK